ncbi:hypothetical protein [Halobacterium rubrum]|uniref:hypothetical protein n=1 Tax=Halobacterium sp. TGN-42-S1 TaxID=2902625 RepID=UPI001F301BF7|nr:hypothetical protein [Halobacterium sp. TGN-42-S1]
MVESCCCGLGWYPGDDSDVRLWQLEKRSEDDNEERESSEGGDIELGLTRGLVFGLAVVEVEEGVFERDQI